MTTTPGEPVSVTLAAIDPPFNADHGVLFGLQSKSGVDDPVPATASTTFHTEIHVRTSRDSVDFAGHHVHGRRGDRFIYLSWGLPDQTEPFVMFARAKIKLAHIPPDLLERAHEHGQALRAEVQATNAKGQPASGTINPPAIQWSIA